MTTKHFLRPTFLFALAVYAAGQGAATAGVSLVQLASYSGPADSSEIVVHDPFSQLLYNTAGGAGVEIIDFANPFSPTQTGVIPMTSIDGVTGRSISSVAADPQGRGFGVATFIPQNSGSNPGKVVFFDPANRTVLHALDVGYHPDSIRFSQDGTKLFIANEGEPISEGSNHYDRPGSLSVIDLSSVATAGSVGSLAPARVSTFDFSAANLGGGVDLNSLRVHQSNNSAAGRVNDAEPEFITESNGKLYVTLQENNAVAEFNLAQNLWTKIHPLGTITQTIDASDQDGGIHIDDVVAGLPMPDSIASLEFGGNTYYVTANEGDTRRADFVASSHPNGANDNARFSQLGSGGRPALDDDTDDALDALYGGNAQAGSALGRLTISLTDGNIDLDPAIEIPTLFGTRSFSIWDALTGTMVFDSGSDFEDITALKVPDLFNSDGDAGSFDSRSDNKGPEPEGLTIGEAFGHTYAFIGMERTGGVMVYDISNPASSHFIDYINTGEIAPESLHFISPHDSPLGIPLLLIGYEVSSRVGVYALQVPEGGSSRSLAMFGLLALAGLGRIIGLRLERA